MTVLSVPKPNACGSWTYNCLFARDVTAAMLEVEKKSISLLSDWELNSFLMRILQEKIILY